LPQRGLFIVIAGERETIRELRAVEAEELVVGAELVAVIRLVARLRVPESCAIRDPHEHRVLVLELHVDLAAVAVDAASDARARTLIVAADRAAAPVGLEMRPALAECDVDADRVARAVWIGNVARDHQGHRPHILLRMAGKMLLVVDAPEAG